MNSSRPADKLLQYYRFKKVRPYLSGDVLDFGGNRGELKKCIKGKYLAVNYDHSAMAGTHFDTIVCSAVIEHINTPEVLAIFCKFKKILNQNGRIILTTPARIAKPALGLMALMRIIDRKSIAEHKHYWNKKEIYDLAERTGFIIKRHEKFQLGFNQLAVFTHKPVAHLL